MNINYNIKINTFLQDVVNFSSPIEEKKYNDILGFIESKALQLGIENLRNLQKALDKRIEKIPNNLSLLSSEFKEWSPDQLGLEIRKLEEIKKKIQKFLKYEEFFYPFKETGFLKIIEGLGSEAPIISELKERYKNVNSFKKLEKKWRQEQKDEIPKDYKTTVISDLETIKLSISGKSLSNEDKQDIKTLMNNIESIATKLNLINDPDYQKALENAKDSLIEPVEE